LAAEQARLAEQQVRIDVLQGLIDEGRRQIEVASADRERAAVERAAAEAGRSAAESRASVAEAERDRLSAELERFRSEGRESAASVISAHRILVVDVMRRMIEREIDRAKRNNTTPDRLRTWMAHFYDSHAELCRAALTPAMRVRAAWMANGADPVAATERVVAAYVEESKRQIAAVLDGDAEDLGGSLIALMTRWEFERAEAIADGLMQEELEHARTS
jgi:hypothetical protein